MKKNRILLAAPLLVLPVLPAFRSSPAMVSFAPAEGSVVTKTFENVSELTLDDMNVTVNGESPPGIPEMDMSMTSKLVVRVTDEYVALRDGAPKTLKRTYDELANTVDVAMSMEMMGSSNSNDQSIESESELEGQTVVFTWSEDDGEYKKAFDDGGDEELLEGVMEDMDLRALLPKGEVAEGDSWQIDVKGLMPILAPGGDLKLVPEDTDTDMMSGGMPGVGSMADIIGDLLEGEAKGTYEGMREVDGVKCAVIKVTIDIQSARDMTDLVLEQMGDQEMPAGMEMDVEHVDVEFEFQGEGELLWDAGAGRARSFHLSGPVEVRMDTGMAMEIPQQGSMAVEQSMEMSGTSNITVTFE